MMVLPLEIAQQHLHKQHNTPEQSHPYSTRPCSRPFEQGHQLHNHKHCFWVFKTTVLFLEFHFRSIHSVPYQVLTTSPPKSSIDANLKAFIIEKRCQASAHNTRHNPRLHPTQSPNQCIVCGNSPCKHPCCKAYTCITGTQFQVKATADCATRNVVYLIE